MNLAPILRVVIALIGFYSIFSAIVGSGLSVIMIPVTFFHFGSERMELTAFTIISVLFGFLLPFLMGTFLLFGNRIICRCLIWLAGAESEHSITEAVSYRLIDISFSLLGLYMLSRTIPSFSAFVAFGFGEKVREATMIGSLESTFVQQNIDHIIYHAVAILFSLFVFLNGKSLSRFVLTIRK